jgi:hypothetical protein
MVRSYIVGAARSQIWALRLRVLPLRTPADLADQIIVWLWLTGRDREGWPWRCAMPARGPSHGSDVHRWPRVASIRSFGTQASLPAQACSAAEVAEPPVKGAQLARPSATQAVTRR